MAIDMITETQSQTSLGGFMPDLQPKKWDPEIERLNQIRPSDFDKGFTDVYQVIRHADFLEGLQEEFDSKKMTWKRGRIDTISHGAVMVAQFDLTNFFPTAVCFVRNSYNAQYALSMAVGMRADIGVRLLGDFHPLHKKHTSGLVLEHAIRSAVMDIPRQYNDGMNTYIRSMAETYPGVDGIPTAKDILWELYLERKCLPVSGVSFVYEGIKELAKEGKGITLLDIHDEIVKRIRFDKSLDAAIIRAQNVTTNLSTFINRDRFPATA